MYRSNIKCICHVSKNHIVTHMCMATTFVCIWNSNKNYSNKLNFHLTSVHNTVSIKRKTSKNLQNTKFSYTLQNSYLFMSQIGQNKTQSTFSHIGYAISHSHAAWGSHCSLYRNQFNLD